MTSHGVTSVGFVTKTYIEILDSLRNKAKEIFGNDIDLSDTSPLLKILQNVAYELYLRWEAMEGVYYSAFVESAIGSSLDQVASIFSLLRWPATKSYGVVVFSGSEPFDHDVTIPSDTSVSTGPYRKPYVVFKTTEEVVLLADDTLVNASAVSAGYGEDQNVVSHTLNELVDPIPGATLFVDNVSPTTSGSDKETDAHLRIRVMGYIYTLGKGTLLAIKNAVSSLAGVVDVLATENLTEHSAHLVVRGGDSDEIDAKIEDTKPAGIFVDWERPDYINFDTTCNVTRLATYNEETVRINVEGAIVDWFASKKIGEDLEFSKIFKEVINAEGVDEVNSLSISGVPGIMDELGETIVIQANEVAVSGSVTVVVS